ncbi:GxxExxY protein [Candidatus Microgenomates bacterium]|nr:GxxExxY protein [Candidatus Microgenomates bacterium]
MAELIYKKLSYKIVGILFDVYNKLGPDYQEKYYQRAIKATLEENKISFKRELPVNLQFGSAKIGRHFVDFVIDDKIVLEIKKVRKLLPKDFKQALTYLKSLNKKLGILANFNRDKLEYRRIINRDYTGKE